MRIRTNATEAQLFDAARKAHVDFARFEVKGSRTHAQTFDVTLSGHTSNRRANGGYGGTIPGDSYAATWDEWGIFLGAIFAVDDTTNAGGVYLDAEDFHYKTDGRFRTLEHAAQHVNHRWTYTGNSYENECATVGCTAVRRAR